MTSGNSPRAARELLIVPGLNGSGPGHWQRIWAEARDDATLVELGHWDAPVKSVWMTRIDQAVRASVGRPLLVAHSLGCLAVAWWAAGAEPDVAARVAGALLVAPPDVDQDDAHPLLRRFAPAPAAALPFPAILVASRDDPYAAFDRLAGLAGRWGASLHDAGAIGHINAQSDLGRWSEGEALVDRLAGQPPATPAPGINLAHFWAAIDGKDAGH